MEKLGFFTPIFHRDPNASFLSKVGHSVESNVDAYFTLKGKRAYIIDASQTRHGYVVESGSTNHSAFRKVIVGALKVATWFTVIIPAFLLVGKLLFRFAHGFYPINATVKKGGQSNQKNSSKIFKSTLNKPIEAASGAKMDYVSVQRANEMEKTVNQKLTVNEGVDFLKIFHESVTEDSNTPNEEVKDDLVGFLRDENIATMIKLNPPLVITKEGQEFDIHEVRETFFTDSNRLRELKVNGKLINNVTVSQEERRNDAKSRAVTTNLLQHLDPDLADRVTLWVHQSLFSKNWNLITADIVNAYAKMGLIEDIQHKVGHAEGLQFEITTDEENIQIEATIHYVIENTEENETPKLYYGIHKRIFLPKKELLAFNLESGSKSDLPNMKVDQVVTPITQSFEESEALMKKAIVGLKPNMQPPLPEDVE